MIFRSDIRKHSNHDLGRVLINRGPPFDVRYAPDSGAKADIAGANRRHPASDTEETTTPSLSLFYKGSADF